LFAIAAALGNNDSTLSMYALISMFRAMMWNWKRVNLEKSLTPKLTGNNAKHYCPR
jgi:hypothetical protein